MHIFLNWWINTLKYVHVVKIISIVISVIILWYRESTNCKYTLCVREQFSFHFSEEVRKKNLLPSHAIMQFIVHLLWQNISHKILSRF